MFLKYKILYENVGNFIYYVINGSYWIYVLTVNIFKNYFMIVVFINIRE